MISKIEVLPLDVANRIAAGEVVERPSSAVKELIENAIDAGARRITVEVAEAGRRQIRVTDDGEGMTQADASRAFLRHATSKIRTDADLFTIRTLGFRGEALPSIAAVSRMRLVTTPPGAPCGTEIRLEGGSIKDEREAPGPPGTMVEVADLFFNTPARKKFLKSPATEFGHICQVVQRLALGFPKIHFHLAHNGSSVVEFTPVHTARERIQQVYGLSLVDGCLDVAGDDEDLRLEGVSSRPLESGSSRAPQEIFINQRWVKCPSLAHAVYEAYGTYLAKGQHPRFVLHLTIDPRTLDMNVHPAKREVRFTNQERLHEWIRRRLRTVISPAAAYSVNSLAHPLSDKVTDPAYLTRPPQALSHPPAQSLPGQAPFPMDAPLPEGLSEQNSPSNPFPPSQPRTTFFPRAAEATQPYLPAVEAVVQPLGQIAERYLLAQVGAELQIIDQHTAHERVLFERLLVEFGQGTIPSQQLLLPQRVEVSASTAAVTRAHAAELEYLGFDVDDFGGGTFLLRAIPALLTQAPRIDPESLLRGVIEDWESELSTGSLQERYQAAIASMACHSAVRSGRRMELPEIQRLLEDWRQTGLPTTCPHGRRIAMRLTIEDLDRIFGRQGWT